MRTSAHGVSPWFLVLVLITAAGGVLATFDGAVALTAGTFLLVLGGWAVSLCLHEFAHAAVAYRGGDRSVVAKGYLTLDIRRYSNAALTFVLPLVFLLIGGLPLIGGAVWIDHGALRSRLTRGLVSLAGPATTLLIGLVLVVVAAPASLPDGVRAGLACLAYLEIIAFVLNILPIPGLDGYGVIEPYLPAGIRRFGDTVRPWAFLVLFALLISFPAASALLFLPAQAIFEWAGGDLSAAADGFDRLLFWQHLTW